MIEQHKRALLEQQRAQDFPMAGLQRRYEPGREHQGSAGERIIATDADLIYLDAHGSILKTEKNWTCACRKSNPEILMMQPAQYRSTFDVPYRMAAGGEGRQCGRPERQIITMPPIG
jgi:hypothetical protein